MKTLLATLAAVVAASTIASASPYRPATSPSVIVEKGHSNPWQGSGSNRSRTYAGI